MKRLLSMGALALALMGFMGVAACGGDDKTGSEAGGDNSGETKLGGTIIITGIPDSKAEDDELKYKKMMAYLTKETGLTFEYKRATDYGAATESVIAGEAHMAWLGGVTTYRAEQGLKDKAVLVACRDIDRKFKSYFIANKDVVAANSFQTVGGDSPSSGGSLDQLKAKAKELSLTFGSKGSTSGHYMPRSFLNKADMAPESTFKSVAFSGNHDNTLKAVAGGAVDIGALNYTNWDKASAEMKANAPIVFVAAPYVDYCWVGNLNKQSKETFKKITDALVKLDASNAEHKEVLDLNSAGKFLAPQAEWWNDIRKVVDDVDANKATIFKE